MLMTSTRLPKKHGGGTSVRCADADSCERGPDELREGGAVW